MNFKITKLKPFGVLIEPVQPGMDVRQADIEKLRQLFREEQLLALRGFSSFEGAEEFAQYCERWGEISVWPFGKVLELVEQAEAKDHIFDHNYVPLHWDGMYRPEIAEYQIFHCVEAPLAGQGGRTTFSNTILALKNAPAAEKALWARVTGVYRRKMEFYDSKTVSPIITRHPHNGREVIRYNEPPSPERGAFLNPPDLEFTGIRPEEREEFHRSLTAALYAPENFYAHQWRKGDVIVADNLSLLHGREGFVSKAPRHIRRVHVLGNPPFKNPGLESYR